MSVSVGVVVPFQTRIPHTHTQLCSTIEQLKKERKREGGRESEKTEEREALHTFVSFRTMRTPHTHAHADWHSQRARERALFTPTKTEGRTDMHVKASTAE